MFNMEECGARIRDLRKTREMTRETLAGSLYISDDHLRKVEAGKKGASIDLLIAIAELFDVSLDYLILGQTCSREHIKKDLYMVINNLTEIAKHL